MVSIDTNVPFCTSSMVAIIEYVIELHVVSRPMYEKDGIEN